MKSTYFALAAFLVGACGLAGTAAAQGSAAESVGPQAVPDARRLELAESYGRSPLRFEANQGQTDGRVKFLSRGNGYALFLTPAEAVLTLRTPAGSGRDAVLRMKLLGSNPSPIITGEEELPGKSNYFIGHDPKRWRTRVSNYGRARFAGVYPGVDLVFYGNRRQLEYDFVVAPGADPSSITLGFAGADSLQIGPQGELTLQVRGGEVTWRKPVVYQEVAGVRRMVPGRYVRKGRTAVGFEVAPYDRRQPLILDPVLAYSTYLGGSDTDEGHGIAVDSSGNAYVTGVTYSTDFPAFPASAFQTVLSGNRDAFVTKLDAGGSLGYSTYLGGSDVAGLPALTEGAGIAVDLSGDAYLTGRTDATDFPTTPGAFQATNPSSTLPNRAFVTKLNAAGDGLIYSTYLGGTNSEVGSGIAVDSAGYAYVVGATFSSDFPTFNAFQAARASTASEVFVTKLNADGSALLYSTYLGGDGHDSGSAIAVDDFGNAYVTGTAGSPVVIPFPTTANAYRTTGGAGPFLAKFDTHASGAASLAYSSLIVDSLTLGIAADGSGNVYLVGRALSNLPTTVGAFQPKWNGGFDAFVAKFNLNVPGPASLVYSTFLGGTSDEEGRGIALDSSGNVYVTGYTNSRNFPTVNAIQPALGGGFFKNVFVAKLNAGGTALVYSTYLGGSAVYGEEGRAIALDSCGNAYVTGITNSGDFPLANAMQATFGGGSGGDAFVAKIEEARLGLSSITVTPAHPTMAAGGSQQFTATGCIDSRLEDLTSRVAWSSATSSVATIDMGGLATGVGAGTSVVTATSGGISGSATLKVLPPIDYSLSASPLTLELPAPSSTQTSMVTLQSRNGASEAVDLTAAWVGAAPAGVTFSLSPARATVPSTGSVTATLTLGTSASPSQGTFALKISGKSASGVMRSLDLSVVIGATLPAPTCGCTDTGPFKDPRVEGLEASSPFANVTPSLPPSSDPLPSVPPAFDPLTLTRNSDRRNIVTGATNVSAFGFSPNGKYFVLITYVSSATGPVFSLTLYSVDAGGQVGPEVQNPLSWGFSPDGDNQFFLVASSDGLSTHVDLNIYDAATGRQVMADRATAYTSFGNPPWADKKNVNDNDKDDSNNDHVGGWGFSPDGNTFVLSYRTSVSAYVLSLWNLARTLSALPSETRPDVASFWQFSPCGDLFMLVSQAGANPGPSDQVIFRHTSNGSPYVQPSLDPSRGAPSATVVSNPGGGYDIQLTGMDRSSISSPQCTTAVTLHSPANIALMDAAGRRTGFDPQAGVVDQIPGGTYTGAGSEPQTVAIPYVAGPYLVDAFGLDTLTSPEPYRLTIVTTDAAGDVFDQAEVSGTAARGSLDTFAFSVGGGPLTLDLVSGDVTPPDVNCAQPDGQWHADDVTIACSAADARSGLADPTDASFSLSTSVPTGIETSDAMTGSRRVCDTAGNCAIAGPIAGNMVDRRAPTIAISAPSGRYLVGENVAADYSCADSGSGVASCTGPVLSGGNVGTATVGARTFTVTAADNAGNSATATSAYDVVYDFVGFFQPIDDLPALNIAAPGRSIPVKFSLGRNQGLTIIAAGFPASTPIPCDVGEAGTGLEESVTSGGNSLSYDATTDQYSYVWKTKKAWKGTCRMLIVGLNDGTQHYARFRFR